VVSAAACLGLLALASCSHAASGAQAGTSAAVGNSPVQVPLPMTVSVSFAYPKNITPTQHMLLATAEQALRAQLHAIYDANPDDPMLKRYWSGRAYDEIRGQVNQWVITGHVPFGVVVVTRTTATPGVGPVSASKVSYCVSLTRVVRGVTRTHVVGAPVEPPGTPGTRETLTVTRPAHHHWTASDIHDVVESKACA
jgi:hypothetical protein